jgi:signal transduction histidine kinase
VDAETEAQIARARSLLIRGDTAIRTVIHRLSGPPAADLGTRLASVVAGVEDEFAIAIHLRVDEDACAAARSLRRPASDALVKVAREALINAAKHAGPCTVGVTLELARRDRLLLTVADDGPGVAVADGTHHHGLASLRRVVRDQGGTLRVSGGCSGTKVTAGMPIGERRNAAAALAEPTVLRA